MKARGAGALTSLMMLKILISNVLTFVVVPSFGFQSFGRPHCSPTTAKRIRQSSLLCGTCREDAENKESSSKQRANLSGSSPPFVTSIRNSKTWNETKNVLDLIVEQQELRGNISGLHVCSAVNTSVAVSAARRLAEIQTQSNCEPIQSLLFPLLENVREAVLRNATEMNAFACSDLLIAFGKLVGSSKRQETLVDYHPRELRPVAKRVCQLLENHMLRDNETILSLLGAKRMVQLLQAVEHLGLGRSERRLVDEIAVQLQTHPNLCERLASSHLSRGFLALVRLSGQGGLLEKTLSEFMRCLSNQSVQRELSHSHVMYVLQACSRLSSTTLHKGAETLSRTLMTQELMLAVTSAREDVATLQVRAELLSVRDISTVLQTAAKFQVDTSNHDVFQVLRERLLVNHDAPKSCYRNSSPHDLGILLSVMQEPTMTRIDIEKVTCQVGRELLQHPNIRLRKLYPLLRSVAKTHHARSAVFQPFVDVVRNVLSGLDDPGAFERFFAGTDEFELAHLTMFLGKHGDRRKDFISMATLGKRYQELASTKNFKANSAGMILRHAVLKFAGRPATMEPFRIGTKHLIQNRSLLDRCGHRDLADLAWFAVMTKWKEELVLLALADRALEPDIVDACSPYAASRILSSLTTLSLRMASGKVRSALYKLFDALGVHLLSSNRLKVHDVSAMIFAYAKLSYTNDMGIFDHLVELFSKLLHRSSIRNVATCLWSCGKMAGCDEDGHRGPIVIDDDFGIEAPPMSEVPYLRHARSFARHLANQNGDDALSVQDTVQALWACGQLNIRDRSIIFPLAYRAMTIAPRCNSQEVSNMLWGLAKVDFDGPVAVKVLSDQLVKRDLNPNTKEAASALYALGRMKVYLPDTFAVLCNTLVSKAKESSAHSITNAMWAYRRVRRKPPKDLLDSWMSQKLGLMSTYKIRMGDSDGRSDSNDFDVQTLLSSTTKQNLDDAFGTPEEHLKREKNQ